MPLGIDLYKKPLCMSELAVQHSKYDVSRFYDSTDNRQNSSFCYVVRGSVKVDSPDAGFTVTSGGLFFIPVGIRYNSVWEGDPEIEYFSLHIMPKKFDSSDSLRRYELQVIPEFSNEDSAKTIREIYDKISSGDHVAQVEALALYYDFFAKILPFMKPCEPKRSNPILEKAKAYIDANFKSKFDMSALSRECCISESRLYHLFRDELGTTPLGYRNEVRVKEAIFLLKTSDYSIENISDMSGFSTAANFRDVFSSVTGFTPSEYRKLYR